MALLVVKDAVDLLGKEVHLFMVLAPIDNTSHMKALASLSEIMYDQENIAILCEGNMEAIMKLIGDKGSK